MKRRSKILAVLGVIIATTGLVTAATLTDVYNIGRVTGTVFWAQPPPDYPAYLNGSSGNTNNLTIPYMNESLSTTGYCKANYPLDVIDSGYLFRFHPDGNVTGIYDAYSIVNLHHMYTYWHNSSFFASYLVNASSHDGSRGQLVGHGFLPNTSYTIAYIWNATNDSYFNVVPMSTFTTDSSGYVHVGNFSFVQPDHPPIPCQEDWTAIHPQLQYNHKLGARTLIMPTNAVTEWKGMLPPTDILPCNDLGFFGFCQNWQDNWYSTSFCYQYGHKTFISDQAFFLNPGHYIAFFQWHTNIEYGSGTLSTVLQCTLPGSNSWSNVKSDL